MTAWVKRRFYARIQSTSGIEALVRNVNKFLI